MPNVSAITDGGNFEDCAYTEFSASSAGARNSQEWSVNTTATSLALGHGKVGSNTTVARYGLAFDLGGNDADGAGISGNTVESAQLIIKTLANQSGFSTITSNTSNTVYLCKMDASVYGDAINNNNTTDGRALLGWVASGTYDGNVTLYEDGNITEAPSSTLTFTLNSTAITDINSAISAGTELPMMFVSHDDFNSNIGTDGLGDPDVGSGAFRFESMRIHTSDASSAANRPIMSLTYAAASGYTHDVSGVASANIGKISSVATANIGKVNSVD
tara:strand:+ start:540 stop:1361 length:822 start_codon:yes stop_codon:yes gene_type:complete